MEQDTFIAELEAFGREHGQAVADLEQQCAATVTRQAECDANATDLLVQMAEFQIGRQVSFGNKIKAELGYREREEQEQRAHLRQAEAHAESALAAHGAARRECEALRHRLYAELAADPAYVAGAQQHQQAREAHVAFQPDCQDLRSECSAKLAAYQAPGSLYAYLRQRGYGGGRYVAAAPIRLLDGWIARLCHFADNRSAEQTLLEMQEELARRAKALDKALAQAEQAERKMLTAASARVGLPAAEESLAKCSRELDLRQTAVAKIREALSTYAEKTDSRYVNVQQLVLRLLSERSIDELAAQAAKTPEPDDDALVPQIAAMQTQRGVLQQEYDALRTRLRDARRERGRADEIRNGLSDALPEPGGVIRCFFEDGLDLRAVLTGYVSGKYSEDQAHEEVWRHSRELGLYHDDDGTISWIEVGKKTAKVSGTVLLAVGKVAWALPSLLARIGDSGGGSSSSSGSRRRYSSGSSSSSSAGSSSRSYSTSSKSGGGSYSTSDSF